MAPTVGRAATREREIGVVLAVTPTGLLTVRSPSERFPPEGASVRDRTGRHTGRVVRVFGPVAQPYLSVRLRRPLRVDEGAALIGAGLVRDRERNDGTE